MVRYKEDKEVDRFAVKVRVSGEVLGYWVTYETAFRLYVPVDETSAF